MPVGFGAEHNSISVECHRRASNGISSGRDGTERYPQAQSGTPESRKPTSEALSGTARHSPTRPGSNSAPTPRSSTRPRPPPARCEPSSPPLKSRRSPHAPPATRRGVPRPSGITAPKGHGPLILYKSNPGPGAVLPLPTSRLIHFLRLQPLRPARAGRSSRPRPRGAPGPASRNSSTLYTPATVTAERPKANNPTERPHKEEPTGPLKAAPGEAFKAATGARASCRAAHSRPGTRCRRPGPGDLRAGEGSENGRGAGQASPSRTRHDPR